MWAAASSSDVDESRSLIIQSVTTDEWYERVTSLLSRTSPNDQAHRDLVLCLTRRIVDGVDDRPLQALAAAGRVYLEPLRKLVKLVDVFGAEAYDLLTTYIVIVNRFEPPIMASDLSACVGRSKALAHIKTVQIRTRPINERSIDWIGLPATYLLSNTAFHWIDQRWRVGAPVHDIGYACGALEGLSDRAFLVELMCNYLAHPDLQPLGPFEIPLTEGVARDDPRTARSILQGLMETIVVNDPTETMIGFRMQMEALAAVIMPDEVDNDVGKGGSSWYMLGPIQASLFNLVRRLSRAWQAPSSPTLRVCLAIIFNIIVKRAMLTQPYTCAIDRIFSVIIEAGVPVDLRDIDRETVEMDGDDAALTISFEELSKIACRGYACALVIAFGAQYPALITQCDRSAPALSAAIRHAIISSPPRLPIDLTKLPFERASQLSFFCCCMAPSPDAFLRAYSSADCTPREKCRLLCSLISQWTAIAGPLVPLVSSPVVVRSLCANIASLIEREFAHSFPHLSSMARQDLGRLHHALVSGITTTSGAVAKHTQPSSSSSTETPPDFLLFAGLLPGRLPVEQLERLVRAKNGIPFRERLASFLTMNLSFVNCIPAPDWAIVVSALGNPASWSGAAVHAWIPYFFGVCGSFPPPVTRAALDAIVKSMSPDLGDLSRQIFLSAAASRQTNRGKPIEAIEIALGLQPGPQRTLFQLMSFKALKAMLLPAMSPVRIWAWGPRLDYTPIDSRLVHLLGVLAIESPARFAELLVNLSAQSPATCTLILLASTLTRLVVDQFVLLYDGGLIDRIRSAIFDAVRVPGNMSTTAVVIFGAMLGDSSNDSIILPDGDRVDDIAVLCVLLLVAFRPITSELARLADAPARRALSSLARLRQRGVLFDDDSRRWVSLARVCHWLLSASAPQRALHDSFVVNVQLLCAALPETNLLRPLLERVPALGARLHPPAQFAWVQALQRGESNVVIGEYHPSAVLLLQDPRDQIPSAFINAIAGLICSRRFDFVDRLATDLIQRSANPASCTSSTWSAVRLCASSGAASSIAAALTASFVPRPADERLLVHLLHTVACIPARQLTAPLLEQVASFAFDVAGVPARGRKKALGVLSVAVPLLPHKVLALVVAHTEQILESEMPTSIVGLMGALLNSTPVEYGARCLAQLLIAQRRYSPISAALLRLTLMPSTIY